MHTHPLLQRWLDLLLRKPRSVLALCVLLTLVGAAGITRLSIDNDFRVYFSDDNPQLAALDNLEDSFARDDTVVFVIDTIDRDVFQPDVLKLVGELTEAGWQLPYSLRVDSLANYQRSYALDDELVVEPLIPDDAWDRPAGSAVDEGASRRAGDDAGEFALAARIRELALGDPQVLHRYVGPDARATVVIVRGILPEGSEEAADELIAAARAMLVQFRAKYPQVRLLLSGGTTANVVLGEAIGADFRTLVPLTVAVIALGLMVLFRNAFAMVAVMSVVVLSVAGAMGVFGWLGTQLSTVSAFVPSIIMTIAVADAVHVLATFFHHLRLGDAREAALREALRVNAGPVLITSVTTAIGVLSLNFSDSPPYRGLGNMVAAGVLWALVLSLSFLPALLALAPQWALRAGQRAERRMPLAALAEFVIRHQRALLAGGALVVAVLAGFVFRNELTERWFEYFDDSFEYRQSIDIADAHIGGVDGIEYVLDSGAPDGINDPLYLATLDAFAEWFRAQENVAFVATLSDTMKRLNRNMHGDDPAWYRIPQSRELAAQYLLLYELSLPAGLGLEQMIDNDRSATLFSVRMRKTDSGTLLALEARAAEWLAANGNALLPTEGTGIDLMFSHLNERNIRSLLQGAALALVLICAALVVALRSLRLGLLSLVPNLAPATLSYGLWGMLVGRIDMALSVVVTMSLGIVVDDTVHFMSKYRRARYERGLSAEDGVRYAFNTVGVALITTTVVLVAGFSVLGASHFNPTRETGTLLTITLAVDFLLLPPLLTRFDRRDVKRVE